MARVYVVSRNGHIVANRNVSTLDEVASLAAKYRACDVGVSYDGDEWYYWPEFVD